MTAERSGVDGAARRDAPVTDPQEGAPGDPRSPQGSEAPRAKARIPRERLSSARASLERQALNSIRARRVRERVGQEGPQVAASAPKQASAAAAPLPPAQPGATATSAPTASGSPPADAWALPQSVRDRFIQDRRRFYFPDGAAAFRDHGQRLTTASENTEVIGSLIEIAKTRGWEEIKVAGTQTFRQHAWRQARLAGLHVRGYRPTAPERAALARSLARQADGAQMELGVTQESADRFGSGSAAARESEVPRERLKPPAAAGPRDLIVGKLLDHGKDSYQFDPRQSMSYFVELGTPQGKRTFWGKDLERAMTQSLSQPTIGDEIAMRRTGADPVTVQRRERDADGHVIAEREVGAARSRWKVEKREFFEARAAAAAVLRDPSVDWLEGGREHPELLGTYLWLEAAQLTALRLRDPEDRKQFVALIRGALADSVARGDAMKPVRLRDPPARVPDRKAREREPGPIRT